MPTPMPTPDPLIDAAEVARILGLAHRNSVSTYRSRYEDFPRGQRAPGRGRTLVWPRSEILAWHEAFTARRDNRGEANLRLDDLVAATARLMLDSPGQDLSIRQIAAEAGVAHSDLYRYAQSKDQLVELATAQVAEALRHSLPGTLEAFVSEVSSLLADLRSARAAPMRVLAERMIRDPGAGSVAPMVVTDLAGLVAAHRSESGATSPVEPRVVAACIGAMVWGLVVFESRWTEGLGLGTIPLDQVAHVIDAMARA